MVVNRVVPLDNFMIYLDLSDLSDLSDMSDMSDTNDS